MASPRLPKKPHSPWTDPIGNGQREALRKLLEMATQLREGTLDAAGGVALTKALTTISQHRRRVAKRTNVRLAAGVHQAVTRIYRRVRDAQNTPAVQRDIEDRLIVALESFNLHPTAEDLRDLRRTRSQIISSGGPSEAAQDSLGVVLPRLIAHRDAVAAGATTSTANQSAAAANAVAAQTVREWRSRAAGLPEDAPPTNAALLRTAATLVLGQLDGEQLASLDAIAQRSTLTDPERSAGYLAADPATDDVHPARRNPTARTRRP